MVVDRKAALRRVGLVVLGANLGLLVAKAAVYETTGSLAVGSEAVNSLSDTLYSLIVLGGLYLTTQPPDFEHPHGHERIEPFVSLVVAVGVFLAGGVVLFEAVQHLSRGLSPPAAGAPAIAVLVGAVVIKLGLYRYVLGVASEFSSPALEATAVDTRTDVLTAGAALTGVVGAVVGIPILDPAAAGLVAVGIIYTGLAIVRDNVGYLVGAGPPEPLREKIIELALAHPDVRGAHDVIAHYVGPEVDVSLHIEVEGDRTLTEAHGIETSVASSISDLQSIDEVFVHVDPREAGEWKSDLSDGGSPPTDPRSDGEPGGRPRGRR